MKDLTRLHPIDYLKILYRRRWYAVAVFLLVGIGAVVYAWRKPDVYRSESRIQVEAAPVPQDYVRPSVRSTPEEQIAAIRSAVKSRSLLERMIQDFQLFGYGMGEDFSMEAAVRGVSKNIEITTSSKNTFNVAFHANNPQLAQSFTRRMVETLIQSRTSDRRSKAVETDQFLEEQLRQTAEKLAAQEEKIKEFKVAHFGRLPDQFDSNMRTLNQLDAQLASVENAIGQLRDRQKMSETMARNQQQMLLMTQQLMTSSPVLPDPVIDDPPGDPALAAKERELEALLLKYTPQYPDVVRLRREIDYLKQKAAREAEAASALAAESSGDEALPISGGDDLAALALPEAANPEIEALENDIRRREKEKASIQRQIQVVQARLNLAPALEQELTALNREYGTLKAQHDNLQAKKFQSQMTTDLETNRTNDTYRVIDEASLPEKPIFPNRIQIVGLGLIAGLVAGIGAAIGRELFDTTLANEEEVTALLKLPVLATISEVPGKGAKKPGRSARLMKSA